MWILITVQLFMIGLFFLLGWAIRKKKAYSLISGFATRPLEEQQQLIENGYPQKTGAMLQITAVGMLLLLPLVFTDIKFAMEIEFGFMLFFLLGGFVYLSKFELPKKRKRSYIISTSFFVVITGFVVGLYILGYQEYELIMKKQSFEITGMYGIEWEIQDIKRIELLEEMPKVTSKQNGFGLATLAKGYFTVTGYGRSLLFIQKDHAPYLYIELSNKKIFINNENPDTTKKWYQELNTAVTH
ncbi:DUF3784 domain-containing protein [Bacillus sp. DNRA2]|uniref:DUF3784 domain-containing protein n=1 Tax=Bacillus sp. DNRA2 TaxID=2723053 RepID=UPI00145E0079|nr:DUF3784 domain-containing protein [Bacillus sp. DNRA2]NMD71357.1 DUF3784 domain-containing protein [Bacillus sp. DNRA2]